MNNQRVVKLLDNAIVNQTSVTYAIEGERRTIQASITGTGTVSATITWYGSNLNTNTGGILLATSNLLGTTTDATGADIPSEWPYMYCILSAISGTGAAATASVGV